MPLQPTLADVAFLCTAAGAAALTAMAGRPLTASSRLSDAAAARALSPEHSSVLLDAALARRAAVGKLDEPQRWLLTTEALQQATASRVAGHRARRLAGRIVHDVTCSVGAELVALGPRVTNLVGSDLDPVRLAMAAHNAPGTVLLRADALHPTSRGTVVLADPGRRSGSGRVHDPRALTPPLPALLQVHAGRDLVVKCAPGLDVGFWSGEVELVSLDGGVREAVLWSDGLSGAVRRRASVLSSSGSSWEVTDADPDDAPVRGPGEWIIDPDGAVVRAGLVRHWAARHGLGQLDPRVAHLTGDALPAGVRGFQVLQHGRFTEKALRAELARADAGSVEILVRAVDVDPSVLRKRLRLSGSQALTVVLTRIGDTPTAFVCTAHGARA
ncbi:MAG: class I SAM-dependent methyltransferase [Mycobacteriaceae bacterium]